jgi:hypothetical protein
MVPCDRQHPDAIAIAFHRYSGSPRAEVRAEELAALINDRPGNLLS